MAGGRVEPVGNWQTSLFKDAQVPIFELCQWLANSDSGAKSAFVNEVLLAHSHTWVGCDNQHPLSGAAFAQKWPNCIAVTGTV